MIVTFFHENPTFLYAKIYEMQFNSSRVGIVLILAKGNEEADFNRTVLKYTKH